MINKIKQETLKEIEIYKNNSDDHYDLSDKTRKLFESRYKEICEIVLGE